MLSPGIFLSNPFPSAPPALVAILPPTFLIAPLPFERSPLPFPAKFLPKSFA